MSGTGSLYNEFQFEQVWVYRKGKVWGQGGSFLGRSKCIMGNGHTVTYLPMDRQIETTENITFTQFRWWMVTINQLTTLSRCLLVVHCIVYFLTMFTEQFFPGIILLAETSYFVRACDELTEEEKRTVAEHFVSVLDENKVCCSL